MPDPNLRLLEEAATKLAPFLREIVFVGGVTLGLLITDKAAAPIRSTDDVDVIAEILTYVDYIAFSERLRKAQFTEDTSEQPLTCRWFHGKLKLDVLALSKEVLGYTNVWYESALKQAISFLFLDAVAGIRSGLWARAIDSRTAESTDAAQRITSGPGRRCTIPLDLQVPNNPAFDALLGISATFSILRASKPLLRGFASTWPYRGIEKRPRGGDLFKMLDFRGLSLFLLGSRRVGRRGLHAPRWRS